MRKGHEWQDKISYRAKGKAVLFHSSKIELGNLVSNIEEILLGLLNVL